jgi:hypothetical protein
LWESLICNQIRQQLWLSLGLTSKGGTVLWD